MYDAVIVGGGHNGLVAATLLARAGRSVVVLERRDHVGGAAVSERPWAGVDARLSRYSYLVSLMPEALRAQMGLRTEMRRRSVSSYSPREDGTGLLVRVGEPPGPSWAAFEALTGRVAESVFPTLTEPLPSRADLRARVGDDAAWEALFERPLDGLLRRFFEDDFERGIIATDALIGTFAELDEPSLRQNRCFVYHVIGNGTGHWDVPVGGMGALTSELAELATAAGAEVRLECEVTGIDPGGEVRFDGGSVRGEWVLANVAPAVLARLLGEPPPDEPAPEGAQLKLNMLLQRLPRLLDASVDPREAFAGTFHVNESAAQLAEAYASAARGEVPSLPPCEIYCHSLTDPTILGPELQASGAQTLTCFGLHMPARLFAQDHDRVKAEAVAATLRSLNRVLAEPIEDCLYVAPDGEPCLEARTPVELEEELGLPGGNIFHRDLAWPFAEDDAEVGTWGVETPWERVLVCGAGARRGGGVSGIPGHNAAMKVLSAGS
ncbi:phytoene dehydrogenase-like protein [Solirubrobacter pauli]|uniref:Pyridine nucleotide-disulfide oxidoreductase domain-containing protein 2 n=1 Tax=Solirubrobacter pauli TaxID=166793 RepID=A0A660LEL4_9ACTN|nr:NAD(P)/FAD-dependent oxidoreductase [Solirubrobacter pauli]RKQ93522.1 phytoene dehydrogenase-like protein [Solirubrobacter pauli]